MRSVDGRAEQDANRVVGGGGSHGQPSGTHFQGRAAKAATITVTVGGDTSIYENVMDWTDVDGNDIHVEQVAVQQWKGGKIIHERFYYATS